MEHIDKDYLLDKKVVIYHPKGLYKASSDAVWLASAVNKVKKGDNILDVGSGGGAVSLCLASRFRDSKINITGIELQKELVQSSNHSAEANGFDFLNYENYNIFEAKLKPCSFSHVVTNPPYSSADMLSPNVSKATAHNFKFEDLKKWLDFCIKMLKPKGIFYIINRAEALENIIAHISGRLGAIEVFPLYSKQGQKAKRVIIRAKKDSKTPLVIHSPIIVHNDDGSYSQKAEQILRKGESI
ncbi:MAG: methyltransferase domain-containing protein [Alphaproteobacteria bacterium]|nr:methyltransferase domain-containing protein [Alphaproteobacteria bacterium]